MVNLRATEGAQILMSVGLQSGVRLIIMLTLINIRLVVYQA